MFVFVAIIKIWKAIKNLVKEAVKDESLVFSSTLFSRVRYISEMSSKKSKKGMKAHPTFAQTQVISVCWIQKVSRQHNA